MMFHTLGDTRRQNTVQYTNKIQIQYDRRIHHIKGKQ